jgi:hypothetical protein
MTPYDEMASEVTAIVQRKMPSAKVNRVTAKPFIDSDSENSLSITVFVLDRPPDEETGKLVEVVDEFRTWLVGRSDERFPYFRLLSEADERELQQINH